MFAVDGVVGFPVVASVSNAIKPGTIDTVCDSQYQLGELLGMSLPGSGITKAGGTVVGLGVTKVFGKSKNLKFFTQSKRKQTDPVVEGQMGQYKELKGQPRDGLTGHHMPSVAALKAHGEDPAKGYVMVLNDMNHVKTRTFRSSSQAKIDKNRDLNESLLADIEDINKILGPEAGASFIKMMKELPNPPKWFDPSRF